MSSSSWQESAWRVRSSAGPSGALGESQSPRPEDLERWKKALLGPAPARVYDSGTHADARMHLGGIGTGNFEIGADGQFTTWQLFNTLRDGEVPFYFLARAGKATRLLQTRGGPDWPRIKQIAMTGEYPVATLRFSDAGPSGPARDGGVLSLRSARHSTLIDPRGGLRLPDP